MIYLFIIKTIYSLSIILGPQIIQIYTNGYFINNNIYRYSIY